jgi:hypothetical protein
MPTFVMLTRIEPGSLHQPRSFETLERQAMAEVRRNCPDVEWVASYALGGRYDYLDVFVAPAFETAMQVSVLFRTYGHAHTEIWPAIEWEAFRKVVHGLTSAQGSA